MKKIVRLTESDLTNIVKRVINEENTNYFSSKMIKFIGRIIDEVISEKTPDEYDAIDYNDYKEEIVWSTISTMEHEMSYDLPRDKVEDFFSMMETPEFDGKIKKGYSRYKRMRE
jgi:hypothetical protein